MDGADTDAPLVETRQGAPGSPARHQPAADAAPQAGNLGACASALRRWSTTGLLCAIAGACVHFADNVTHDDWLRTGDREYSQLEGEGSERQVKRLNATWVKGDPGENCQDACERRGLTCYSSEDSWPRKKAELAHIARGLGLECKHFVSAENTYDPFVIGPYCSFGPWKPDNVWGPWRPNNVRSCKAMAPVATTRLCSCVQDIPAKQCQECSTDCWKNKSCCKEEDDKCALDPLNKKWPHSDWWGSTPGFEWTGVDPAATCMRDHPDSWEDLPRLWDAFTKRSSPLRIKVLTYNLFWWNLFDQHGGRDGAAGHLVNRSGRHVPYDLLGFQECEDLQWVLGDADLLDYGQSENNNRSVCIAWRSEVWSKLSEGFEVVGNDGGWVKNNMWGDRIAAWVRLEHRKTGDKVFFVNHHGPLPLNSGGECGGLATAYNLLSVIKASAEKHDIVVMVGDFNSDFKSATVKLLESRLHLVYHGKSFGGIDNIFTNTEEGSFVEKENLGGAGSDHDAISATIQIEPRTTTTTTTTTEQLETTEDDPPAVPLGPLGAPGSGEPWRWDENEGGARSKVTIRMLEDPAEDGAQREPGETSVWSSVWSLFHWR